MKQYQKSFPPGAEVYREDWSETVLGLVVLFFGLEVILLLLLILIAKSIVARVGLLVFMMIPILLIVGLRLFLPEETVISGTTVELRKRLGAAIQFELEEITGWRYYYNGRAHRIQLFRGDCCVTDICGIPGEGRIRQLLRSRGCPPLVFGDETLDSFRLTARLRVEGDELIHRKQRYPLSSVRVAEPLMTTELLAEDGTKIASLSATIKNLDLLGWRLEQQGVSFGDLLPKL